MTLKPFNGAKYKYQNIVSVIFLKFWLWLNTINGYTFHHLMTIITNNHATSKFLFRTQCFSMLDQWIELCLHQNVWGSNTSEGVVSPTLFNSTLNRYAGLIALVCKGIL